MSDCTLLTKAENQIHFTGLMSEVSDFLSPLGHKVSNFAHYSSFFGTSLGRYPHISWRSDIYPAMNWVIVGRTAAGKGESLEQVTKLFELGRHSKYLLAPVMKGEFTSGKNLVKQIHDLHSYYAAEGETRVLAICEEFVSMLANMLNPINKLSSVLINLNDGTHIVETIRDRTISLVGTHFGLIGHITPESLGDYMKERLIVNGMANRLIFVHIPSPEYRSDSGASDEDEYFRIQGEIRKSLDEGGERGPIELEADAYERFSAFDKEIFDYSGSELVRCLLVRFPKACLKVALCIALTNREEKVSLASMESACAVMAYSQATLEYYFGAKGVNTPDFLIRQFIESKSSATKTEITNEFAKSIARDAMDAALVKLEEQGLIISTISFGGRGRRTTTYTPAAPRVA